MGDDEADGVEGEAGARAGDGARAAEAAAAEAAAAAVVRDAVGRLRAAGVAPEVIGTRVVPRRVLGLGGAPRISAVGEAWRVGGLLLLADGSMALPGESVLTRAEGRRGYAAESARHRSELREEARRGGVPDGVVVHVDPRPVVVGEAPVAVRDGEAWFAWAEGAAPVRLAAYVAERVALVEERRGG